MSANGPQSTRRGQIGGRVESTLGTSETLDAFDFKSRVIMGISPGYEAPREPRNLARPSLSNLGSSESTKAVPISFQTEINTPDAWNAAATSGMDVESVLWQSGNIIRYTFNGTPDLSGIQAGDYFTCYYEGSSVNNGTFKIHAVNDGSDYVEVINRARTSNADDTASLSTGVGDVQSAFEHSWMFESAGCRLEALVRIAIGAVTSGPYEHGETITGGTSSATGKIIVPAKNGDSYIYFVPLTGTFQSGETITGGTSSASCSSSSAPVVHGMGIKPASDCHEAATVRYEEDGYQWSARSAMANVTLNLPANSRGLINFDFNGPRLSIGDQALTTNVVRGQEDPTIFKTANLKLNASTDNFEPVFSNVTIDLANQVVLRPNGNAADDTGFESARIPSREPKITISHEHELASVFDFYSKLDSGAKTSLEFHHGDSETKQFWFFADELEFSALPPGENENIRTLDTEAMLTGNAADLTGDDEWYMAFIGD